MILYDFICTDRHRFEAGLDSMYSDNPPCPICGAATSRRPSTLNIGGVASTGADPDSMPVTWRGVGNGDAETIRHWHKLAEQREKLEEKHPELAPDRRPVLAHEGIFQGRPLRVGDDIPAAIGEAVQAAKTEREAKAERQAESAKAKKPAKTAKAPKKGKKATVQ